MNLGRRVARISIGLLNYHEDPNKENPFCASLQKRGHNLGRDRNTKL